jgi:nitroreductase
MIEGLHADIESILAAGNQAPSGENCQPWHFVVKGETIDVHLLPERDQSYYGWGQRASYMANGAALENMRIAAPLVGYRADMAYLPSQSDPYHVATISLVRDPSATPLDIAQHIFHRVTNRKPYFTTTPGNSEKQQLSESVSGMGVRLALVAERSDVVRLAQVGAANEEIMLSNRALHQFFFSHVNWTKKEDDEKKIGFYIKTLELPGPGAAAFYVIQNWQIMDLLRRLNFHAFVAAQNASIYAASSAIGAIIQDGDSPADYIKTGQALQRLWLTATKLGYSMQPLTGVLFFKLRLDNGEGDGFSEEQKQRIEVEYAAAQKLFECPGKRIGFMFRMGPGASPSARASRFDLKDAVSLA